MSHTVTIEDTGVSYACPHEESLLEGMRRLGLRGIPVGCRNGGCGVCKVEVTSGDYRTRVMSREYVSEEDLAQGRLLACRAYPRGDVSLKVIGKLQKSVCRPPSDR